MTHTAGLLSLPCTARGGTVVVLTKPDPALLLGAIPKHRVTELFLPPTVIYRLLDIPDLQKKVDFSSLKYFMYGAAPMSVEKLKQAIEVFGPVMMGGYGQTEAPGSISYPAAGRALQRRQGRPRRAPVVGRPAQSAGPRRDHERRERDPAAGRDRRDLRARRPGHEGLLQGRRTRPPRPSSTAGCTPATSATSTTTATCTSPTARRT